MSLLWALFPSLAPAHGSTDGERVKKRLQQVEASLRAGEWARAGADATKTIDWMVRRNASGEGALPFYGLAYAFRAIAEEGLGQRAAALFDWDAARMLDSGSITLDAAAFGAPGIRIATVASDRSDELSALQRGSGASAGPWPSNVSNEGSFPGYPEAARRSGDQVQLRIVVLVDEEGRIRAPLLEREGERIGRTAFVVSSLEALRKWKFEPARDGDRAVPSSYSLTYNFATR